MPSTIPQRLPQREDDIIAGVPRAVAQLERKRLGLIFGSGISRDFQIPDWNDLVEKISKDANVKGQNLLRKLTDPDANKSLASITQILFGRYRHRAIRTGKLKRPLTFLQEQEIRSAWLRTMHRILYAKIDHDRRAEIINDHAYLPSFLTLIKNTAMTVNYNFDDTLEKLLLFNRTPDERLITRGYETLFMPNAQCQRDSGVIYHPNGYLPSTFSDGVSPDVVFADA